MKKKKRKAFCGVAKAVSGGKFIILNAYIKGEKKFKINNQCFSPKKSRDIKAN